MENTSPTHALPLGVIIFAIATAAVGITSGLILLQLLSWMTICGTSPDS